MSDKLKEYKEVMRRERIDHLQEVKGWQTEVATLNEKIRKLEIVVQQQEQMIEDLTSEPLVSDPNELNKRVYTE